jgi:hypothetical protein
MSIAGMQPGETSDTLHSSCMLLGGLEETGGGGDIILNRGDVFSINTATLRQQ